MQYTTTTQNKTGIVARAKTALTSVYDDKELGKMTDGQLLGRWQRMVEATAIGFTRSQQGPDLTPVGTQ